MSTRMLDMRATTGEVKTAFDGCIGKLVKAEKRLAKLLDMSVRASRKKEQRDNGKKNAGGGTETIFGRRIKIALN